ncbi:MAG: phosphoribosylformylglycinamidine synthase subunit PurQ [Planctomycetota bacterium]
MTAPKAIVLRTSGINCDLETEFALSRAGFDAKRVHIEDLIGGREELRNYSIMVIPGGFSYGDDIASGRVLANEMRYLLGDKIFSFLDNGGLALGICNGFQVMVKFGLLPYRIESPDMQAFSLVDNECCSFVDRWVRLKPQSRKCVFLSDDEIVELPVAHAEGRFIANDNALIDELFERDQVVFTYVDEKGEPAGFPDNPNGSYRGVAAVCDETGRVLGMMPHPERFISPYNHPRHTREGLKEIGDGFRIFRNAYEYAIKEVR